MLQCLPKLLKFEIMSWYGKNDEEETQEQKIVREVKKALKKKEEYDGGNLRVIKASGEDEEVTTDND